MRSVWKFTLRIVGEQEVELPRAARFLHAEPGAYMGGTIDTWWLVWLDSDTERRTFAVRGTGHQVGDDLRYMATVRDDDDAFVWHLFEKTDE